MGYKFGDIEGRRRAEKKRLAKESKREERRAAHAEAKAAMKARFIGWYRPNELSKWKKICEGATYAEALNTLLDSIKGGDKTITRDGEPEPR